MIIKRSSSRRIAAIGVGILGLLLMVVTHVHGHRMYFDRLDTDRTLYRLPRDQAPPRHPPPLARRLWILVLDGLRDDVGDKLPNARRLAAQGVRRVVRAEFPSFTFASLTTMTTGVIPLYSGVRMNTGRAYVPLQTLFDSASQAGVPTRVVTDWGAFDQALDRRNAPGAEHFDVAALLSRAPAHEIVWVHFEDIDSAGHEHGASSSQYLEAARRGDALLGRMAAAIDPSRDVLVALADHGHRARGGHGGTEPEVRDAFFFAIGPHLGKGVRLPPGRMRDVCSTLALLAGIAPPRDNLGAPMLDLLDLPDADLARSLAPAWTQRSMADAAFTLIDPRDPGNMTLEEALTAGDGTAVKRARTVLAERERAREGNQAARSWARERVRLMWGFGLALLMGAIMLWARLCGALVMQARDWVPCGVYVAIFYALYMAVGYPPLSWSIPRGAASFMIETAAMGLVAALCAFGSGRLRLVRGDGGSRQVEQSASVLALWALYVLVAAAVGQDPAWLAGPRLSFGLVLLATAEFYVAGALGLAALVHALSSYFRPSH